MKQAELKPCPFCNGKAKLTKIKTKRLSSEEMVDAYCVICTANECGCLTQYCLSPEEAEKMWNRRTNNDKIQS